MLPALDDCAVALTETKALPVRGWRATTSCAALLSQTVCGPVLPSPSFDWAFGKLRALGIVELVRHVEFLDALDDYGIMLTKALGTKE